MNVLTTGRESSLSRSQRHGAEVESARHKAGRPSARHYFNEAFRETMRDAAKKAKATRKGGLTDADIKAFREKHDLAQRGLALAIGAVAGWSDSQVNAFYRRLQRLETGRPVEPILLFSFDVLEKNGIPKSVKESARGFGEAGKPVR